MRRPCADREEKRVTRGSDMIRTRTHQEQLDLADPNQRGLLARCSTDDDGKMILTATSETGYEHHCKFIRKEKISDNTWRLKSTCSGEGMRWSVNSITTIEGNRLTYHSISQVKAGTNVYQRCGK